MKPATGPEGLLELLATHGGKTSLTSWLRDRATEFAQQWQAERDGGLAAGLEGSYAVSMTWERYCKLTDCETELLDERADAEEANVALEEAVSRNAELEALLDTREVLRELDAARKRIAELEAEQAAGYRSALNGGPGRLEQRWAEMHPAAAAEHERRTRYVGDSIAQAVAAMQPYPETTLTRAEEHEQAVGRG